LERVVMEEQQKGQLEGNIKNYYDADMTHNAYDKCWGPGNIHMGYFLDLDSDVEDASPQSYLEAAKEMTRRMAKLAGIDNTSTVLDLGCGYGGPAIDLASETGCKVVGVDISEVHLNKAQEAAQNNPEAKVEFILGSFLDLPDEVKDKSFTHVFSQVAICHVHENFENVISSAFEALPSGGGLILLDLVGPKGGELSELTKVNVYDRLKFTTLLDHDQYKQKVTDAGFSIKKYEDLHDHLLRSYEMLTEAAKDDYEELHKQYAKTCEAVKLREYGMNLVFAVKE